MSTVRLFKETEQLRFRLGAREDSYGSRTARRWEHTVTDDRAREAAAIFAVNLAAAIGERDLGDVAVRAAIDEWSLRALIEGRVVPDLADIVALERALDVDLWPALPN